MKIPSTALARAERNAAHTASKVESRAGYRNGKKDGVIEMGKKDGTAEDVIPG